MDLTLKRKPFPIAIKTFGDTLRKARLEHRLTQRQLAAKLNVAREVIQGLEGGIVVASPPILSALSEVLGPLKSKNYGSQQ